MRDYVKHGLTHHPLYNTWKEMKQRCYNKNHTRYEDYGGRGISVCDEWVNDFPQFLSDMGEKPTPNHTLDRVDNSLGYSPDNCQWRTKKEQNENRRKYHNARMVTINNKEYSLKELSEEYGLKCKLLNQRWDRGIRDESILKPPRSYRRDTTE